MLEHAPPTNHGGARLAGRRRRTCEHVRGISESPQATSESAGEGVAERSVRVSRGRVHHTLTATSVRNRLGRVWPNWCPDVARSCSSHSHYHTRIGSAGEGVAERSVRVSRGRVHHTLTATHVSDRLGRVWLKEVSVCRRILLLTQTLPHMYRISPTRRANIVPAVTCSSPIPTRFSPPSPPPDNPHVSRSPGGLSRLYRVPGRTHRYANQLR